MNLSHHFIIIPVFVLSFLSAESRGQTTANAATDTSTINASDGSARNALPKPIRTMVSGGTIQINCNMHHAEVTINNMTLGSTPFISSGFLPGFYSIQLSHPTSYPFSKMIQITGTDTIALDVELIPKGESAMQHKPVYAPAPKPQEPMQSPPAGTLTDPGVTVRRSLPKGSGVLRVTANTDDAMVIINKVQAGVAPLQKNDLIPGYYEVEVKKDGFKPFRKMVQVSGNDTVAVEATLITVLSRLIISTIPPAATVYLNKLEAGSTPFDSSTISPGLYTVHIEKKDYVPRSTQVTLKENRTDSLHISLITIAHRDSVRKVNLRRFQIFRQIFFSGLSAGTLSAGIYYNIMASEKLTAEKKAWQAYLEPNLSGAEYDERIGKYQSAAVETDRFMKNRNICYILSAIGALGLTISIPF